MEIKIEEYGLRNILDIIKSDLAQALNSKKTKYKNEYINKAYGSVIAISKLVEVEDGSTK